MFKVQQLIIGIGAITTAGILFSFAGEDSGKKKKYHVIHHKDGVMMEFDTILPMSSEYSVEDFLAEKGVESENVQIINVSEDGANIMFNGKDGDHHQMFVHHFDEDITITDENGTREEVKIIREKGDDGKITVKKFVNGEEVELTAEEEKRLSEDKLHHVRVHVMEEHMEEAEEMEVPEGIEFHHQGNGKSENVVMKVEIDEDGNTVVQKFVNGEEVEISKEEMERIQMHHDYMDDHQMIFIEEAETNLENLDSMLMEFEIEIEELEEEEGAQRVIIKEFHIENEERSKGNTEFHEKMLFHHQVGIEGEAEDFTIVLVTENLDENAEFESTSNVRSTMMNEPISIYPNPNKGTFTIAFEQKEKVKTSVEIVDAQGKVVFKEKLGSFSGAYKKEVNLEKHGKGVYIVNVQQGDETSARKVIVD